MKRIVIFLFPVLIVGYLAGPKPSAPVYENNLPSVPASALELEIFISEKESRHKLKPGNQAQIVWADSSKSKSEYVIVYLHGFSASHREGAPIHTEIADHFGANLYLSRLADHGVDSVDALYHFTAERLWQSGKDALAVGKKLGDKVILVSTSTGGTLALMLAAAFPDDVYALVNLSPNIRINNPLASLTNNPWGLQITRLSQGGKTNEIKYPEERIPYWNASYRYEAIVQLQELIESAMTEQTFKKVKQPSLTLYYYKDEEHQDPIVRVDAMLWMHENLGTPDSLKRAVPIPEAGNHVIACDLTSEDLESVRIEILDFMEHTLNMKPTSH